MADCIFCKIVAGEIPAFKLLENEQVLAFMDINPFNDGHCLVISKRHAENLYSIEDTDLAAVAVAAKRLAGAVNETVRPHGINLVQANGPGAGQSVFHFHMHVFPRQEEDEAMMNWGHKTGDMARIEALAKEIRAALS